MTYSFTPAEGDDWAMSLRATLQQAKFGVVFLYGGVYENTVRVVVGLLHYSGTPVTPFGVAKLISIRLLGQSSRFVPTVMLQFPALLGIALAHASLGRISDQPAKDAFDPFNGDIGYPWLARIIEEVRHSANARQIRQFLHHGVKPQQQAAVRTGNQDVAREFGIDLSYDKPVYDLPWQRTERLVMGASFLALVRSAPRVSFPDPRLSPDDGSGCCRART